MNGKITTEEFGYADKLIGLVKKYLKENEVVDIIRDSAESTIEKIKKMIAFRKDFRSGEDVYALKFRARIHNLKYIYGCLLTGRGIVIVQNTNRDGRINEKSKNMRMRLKSLGADAAKYEVMNVCDRPHLNC